MSSYTTQDPSAYYLKGAGDGLWSNQGAMAQPYLYTPGSSAGYGTSAAASDTQSLLPSVATPTTGVTNATASGLSAAATTTAATRSAIAAPATRMGIAVPAAPQYTVNSAADGVVGGAAGAKVAANQAQPLGYAVAPDTVPKIVANTQNGDTVAYYQWDPKTSTYTWLDPYDFQSMHVAPGAVTSVEGDITTYGQTQAAAAVAAQKQTQANAMAYSAQQAATAAPAATAQNSNFDFGSAFSQTPQATAAVASAQSAQNSLGSQLSTNNYQSGNIAAAGRYGAAQEVNTSGQNQLAIQSAQAADTDQNFAALGNAMQAASSNATNTTAAQANADVSAIQDDVSALSAQLTTLDGVTRARAQTQLTSLQNQIYQYQQAVAQAGADSTIAKAIFTGLLAAGAAVAVVATGGTAAVAIGAATAASAAGKAA